jgi:mRNA interferase MazF
MVVNQGDIIRLDLNPRLGHEQAGYRPAVVVSNDFFNSKTQLAIVCPITNTDNHFPLHVALDSRTQTTGFVLCEHIRAVDIASRNCRVIEPLPADLLEQVLSVVFAEIEA